MSRIGFIGLGKMGAPMTANLVRAGHRVRGYDIVEANAQAAVANGVERADSADVVLEDADCVVLMLPAGEHVREVATNIVPKMREGSLLIDSSTIDVATSRDVHRLCKAQGVRSLDAPVSGGVGGATEGTLTFMVGGSEEAFSAAKDILDPMAGRVVHCGAAGAGQAAKICNNMLLGISMIGVSEAFILAEKLGLSHQALFDVASSASGRCWSLDTYCPVPGPVPASPANRDYEPGFAVELMLKDLRLAQTAATTFDAQTPLGAEATQIYALLNAHGEGQRDFSAVIEFLRGAGMQEH